MRAVRACIVRGLGSRAVRAMHGACVAGVCASLLASGTLLAQERGRSAELGALLSGRKAPVDAELRELTERLDALARSRDADAIAEPLAQARAALGEARAATAAKDQVGSGRARQLAWAALTLAARRVALRQTERARASSLRRAERAEAELTAELAALQALRARSAEATP